MTMLDRAYIWSSIRLSRVKDNVKDFFSRQDGVSNVVAVIIVLLITVLLIAAFWSQLKEWIQGIMDNIFGTTFTSDGLDS